jgi:tetratricopeptide (TPR) repeat protein
MIPGLLLLLLAISYYRLAKEAHRMQVDAERFSWFQVPEDIKSLLILAAENWENTLESEKYINQALAKTGEHTEVLVAAYRYFFYKNKYNMALHTAAKLIDKIRLSEQLPESWEQLKLIIISRKDDPQIRLYLNAYAASGLVLAKLGKLEEAKKISAQVKEIDEKNEFGAIVLLDILTRPHDEDE